MSLSKFGEEFEREGDTLYGLFKIRGDSKSLHILLAVQTFDEFCHCVANLGCTLNGEALKKNYDTFLVMQKELKAESDDDVILCKRSEIGKYWKDVNTPENIG